MPLDLHDDLSEFIKVRIVLPPFNRMCTREAQRGKHGDGLEAIIDLKHILPGQDRAPSGV